eukprot:jgi/Psemu1/61771/gm1.61771_g
MLLFFAFGLIQLNSHLLQKEINKRYEKKTFLAIFKKSILHIFQVKGGILNLSQDAVREKEYVFITSMMKLSLSPFPFKKGRGSTMRLKNTACYFLKPFSDQCARRQQVAVTPSEEHLSK